jgi:hypothetical protein
MGPLRPESVASVQAFSRCGNLASGFTRLACTGCGHQHLLDFTYKARHHCPACHQRGTVQSARWAAHHFCLPVPPSSIRLHHPESPSPDLPQALPGRSSTGPERELPARGENVIRLRDEELSPVFREQWSKNPVQRWA